MNIPAVLNIAIGAVFIFLILSLLTAEVQELIATILQWRAIHLKRSIEILLSGGEPNSNNKDLKKIEEIVDDLYNNPLIKNINQEAKKGVEAQLRKLTSGLADLGYEKKGLKRRTGPSYIPAETFATTLVVRLKIPVLVHQLSCYSLRKIISEELIPEVKNIVETNEEPVRSDLRKKVQEVLTPKLERVINNFEGNKTNLFNCIAQLSSGIDIYVEESGACFENDVKKDKFDKAIKSIKEEIFGLNDKHEEFLNRVRPSLTQVIELFDKESKISRAFFEEIDDFIEGKDKLEYAAYKELKVELEKLRESLPSGVRESLAALAERTQIKVKNVEQELNQFQKEIEVWFDRSMERASGVYKRNAKGIAFLIGFVVAAIANADTFYIVNRLSNDDALQKAIISTASQASASSSDVLTVKDEVNKALADISLPIGWASTNVCKQSGYFYLENTCSAQRGIQTQPKTDQPIYFVLHRLPGWFLSGLATTMGAPFWFELLGRFINVRNAGKKPASPTNAQTASQD